MLWKKRSEPKKIIAAHLSGWVVWYPWGFSWTKKIKPLTERFTEPLTERFKLKTTFDFHIWKANAQQIKHRNIENLDRPENIFNIPARCTVGTYIVSSVPSGTPGMATPGTEFNPWRTPGMVGIESIDPKNFVALRAEPRE